MSAAQSEFLALRDALLIRRRRAGRALDRACEKARELVVARRALRALAWQARWLELRRSLLLGARELRSSSFSWKRLVAFVCLGALGTLAVQQFLDSPESAAIGFAVTSIVTLPMFLIGYVRGWMKPA